MFAEQDLFKQDQQSEDAVSLALMNLPHLDDVGEWCRKQDLKLRQQLLDLIYQIELEDYQQFSGFWSAFNYGRLWEWWYSKKAMEPRRLFINEIMDPDKSYDQFWDYIRPALSALLLKSQVAPEGSVAGQLYRVARCVLPSFASTEAASNKEILKSNASILFKGSRELLFESRKESSARLNSSSSGSVYNLFSQFWNSAKLAVNKLIAMPSKKTNFSYPLSTAEQKLGITEKDARDFPLERLELMSPKLMSADVQQNLTIVNAAVSFEESPAAIDDTIVTEFKVCRVAEILADYYGYHHVLSEEQVEQLDDTEKDRLFVLGSLKNAQPCADGEDTAISQLAEVALQFFDAPNDFRVDELNNKIDTVVAHLKNSRMTQRQPLPSAQHLYAELTQDDDDRESVVSLSNSVVSANTKQQQAKLESDMLAALQQIKSDVTNADKLLLSNNSRKAGYVASTTPVTDAKVNGYFSYMESTVTQPNQGKMEIPALSEKFNQLMQNEQEISGESLKGKTNAQINFLCYGIMLKMLQAAKITASDLSLDFHEGRIMTEDDNLNDFFTAIEQQTDREISAEQRYVLLLVNFVSYLIDMNCKENLQLWLYKTINEEKTIQFNDVRQSIWIALANNKDEMRASIETLFSYLPQEVSFSGLKSHINFLTVREYHHVDLSEAVDFEEDEVEYQSRVRSSDDRRTTNRKSMINGCDDVEARLLTKGRGRALTSLNSTIDTIVPLTSSNAVDMLSHMGKALTQVLGNSHYDEVILNIFYKNYVSLCDSGLPVSGSLSMAFMNAYANYFEQSVDFKPRQAQFRHSLLEDIGSINEYVCAWYYKNHSVECDNHKINQILSNNTLEQIEDQLFRLISSIDQKNIAPNKVGSLSRLFSFLEPQLARMGAMRVGKIQENIVGFLKNHLSLPSLYTSSFIHTFNANFVKDSKHLKFRSCTDALELRYIFEVSSEWLKSDSPSQSDINISAQLTYAKSSIEILFDALSQKQNHRNGRVSEQIESLFRNLIEVETILKDSGSGHVQSLNVLLKKAFIFLDSIGGVIPQEYRQLYQDRKGSLAAASCHRIAAPKVEAQEQSNREAGTKSSPLYLRLVETALIIVPRKKVNKDTGSWQVQGEQAFIDAVELANRTNFHMDNQAIDIYTLVNFYKNYHIAKSKGDQEQESISRGESELFDSVSRAVEGLFQSVYLYDRLPSDEQTSEQKRVLIEHLARFYQSFSELTSADNRPKSLNRLLGQLISKVDVSMNLLPVDIQHHCFERGQEGVRRFVGLERALSAFNLEQPETEQSKIVSSSSGSPERVRQEFVYSTPKRSRFTRLWSPRSTQVVPGSPFDTDSHVGKNLNSMFGGADSKENHRNGQSLSHSAS